MAKTNFQIFNEENTPERTYNDSEYKEATQRVGGVIPGMALSRMHNKMYYQWSAMCKAIANLIVNRGRDCMDSDVEGITRNLEEAIQSCGTAGITTHRTASELDHPDGSVTTPKLRDAAVTGAKIANKAIGKEHLKDGVVDDKAPIASPALTGTPTVPTASKGTSTDQIASTAFVAQAIADAVLAIAGHETPTITALIDWELMATENNGVDARNLWNAESGIKACGGDNTSKSGYGKSCILLKQVYTDFDKILVIGCDDACTVCTRRVFNKWELDLMFANSFIFNIVDDNGAIWRIFGGKKGTYTGELSAGKVWRTHSQGCGIIEIYGIKY